MRIIFPVTTVNKNIDYSFTSHIFWPPHVGTNMLSLEMLWYICICNRIKWNHCILNQIMNGKDHMHKVIKNRNKLIFNIMRYYSITSKTWLTLKFAIFTVPLRETKRFWVFMSICTIFCFSKEKKIVKIQYMPIATWKNEVTTQMVQVPNLEEKKRKKNS